MMTKNFRGRFGRLWLVLCVWNYCLGRSSLAVASHPSILGPVLLEWFQKTSLQYKVPGGNDYLLPFLEFRDGGLFATRFIPQGTTIIEITKEFLWMPPLVPTEEDDDEEEEVDDEFENSGQFHCLNAQVLAKEFTSYQPFHPYIDYLYWHSENTVPGHPASWTLTGKQALTELLRLMAWPQFDTHEIVYHDPNHPDYEELFWDLDTYELACRPKYHSNDDPILSSIPSETLYQAHRLVVSRSWWGTLAPIVDLVNSNCAHTNFKEHYETYYLTEKEFIFDDENHFQDHFHLIASQPIPKGHELLSCYNEARWSNTLNTFRQFGFIEQTGQRFVFEVPLLSKENNSLDSFMVEWNMLDDSMANDNNQTGISVASPIIKIHCPPRESFHDAKKKNTHHRTFLLSPHHDSKLAVWDDMEKAILVTLEDWLSSTVMHLEKTHRNNKNLPLSVIERSTLNQLHKVLVQGLNGALLTVRTQQETSCCSDSEDDFCTSAESMMI